MERLQTTFNSIDNAYHVWWLPTLCLSPFLCSSALMQRSAPWWKVDSLGTAKMAKLATSLIAAAMTQGVWRQRPQASGERSLRYLVRIQEVEGNLRSLKAWVNQGVSRRAVTRLWVWPLPSPIPLRACSKSQVSCSHFLSVCLLLVCIFLCYSSYLGIWCFTSN